MKTLVFPLVFVGFFCFGSAQKGQIHIEQDEKIDELIEIYKSTNEDDGFYTIQVGFGSLQKAQRIKNNVDTDFPGWNSKIKFETPSYRVRVGKFKTKLEAERKFNELRKKYPEAMLLNPEKK
ncbi:SPOR domain-containing protein [Costertonia aggregata]|uniref:SPOR domain-containing protein n=1 Tax=Costertonia aggregata TaxID=343403 RepID=A0A7H9AMF9_9FLAO|nr:SPOR domain-containing protein [Costertonia aggregata]QLG44564.1 SPOR domain-containing protein [Costertonia aggregata]